MIRKCCIINFHKTITENNLLTGAMVIISWYLKYLVGLPQCNPSIIEINHIWVVGYHSKGALSENNLTRFWKFNVLLIKHTNNNITLYGYRHMITIISVTLCTDWYLNVLNSSIDLGLFPNGYNNYFSR